MIKDSQGKILFSDKELACRHCGELKLAPDFAEKLKELRLDFGLPMIVTSCCRCPQHNKKIGGNPRSFHLTENKTHQTAGCCAIDVKRRNAEYDRRLMACALRLGWSVGIAKSFFHFDRRSDYTLLKPALFTY